MLETANHQMLSDFVPKVHQGDTGVSKVKWEVSSSTLILPKLMKLET